MDSDQFFIILLGMITLIIIYTFIGALFEHRNWHFLHETGAGLIIGCLFGVIIYFLKNTDFQFNQELFFYALLPPMIFAGGYNLKKRKFMQNIKYIVLFGVIGTLTSFGVIFGLTYAINKLNWIIKLDNQPIILSLAIIIKYSATICASDSVAALTLISPKQYPKLFAIVFGEGMVNDAIAIILFQSIGGIVGDDASDSSASSLIFGILLKFIYTILASIAIGLIMGLICSLGFRYFRFLSHNPVSEVVVLYSFGILSYVIAEVTGMSGVLTVLVCGVTLAHFNFYNLSITGQLSTGVTFQSVSFIAQAIVFLYLGITFISYVTQNTLSFTFLFLQLAICIIGRNVAIFGLSFLVKICDRSWSVSWYELAIASMAGTIRGSVAFALILTLEEKTQQIQIVKSTVIMMVFITTIFLGAIMPRFINFCLSQDVSAGKNQSIMPQSRATLLQSSLKNSGKPRKFFKVFDQDYLKPFFIYNYKQRKSEIKEFKNLLKLNSPQYKGGQFVALMKANVRQSVIADIVYEPKPSQLTFQSKN